MLQMSSGAGRSEAPMQGGQYPSAPMAWSILICCMLGYGLSVLDRQILALMVDLVKADLRLSDTELGLLQGLAFATFYSVLIVVFGFLADRKARKLLIAAGVVFWSAATVACGFATGFWTMFLARMCVGIGEAVLVPSAYSLISDSFPRNKLVTALAVFGFAAVAGGGFAILVGGLVVDIVSQSASLPFGLSDVAPWRVVFGLVGLPGLVLGPLFLLLTEPSRKDALVDADGNRKQLSVREAAAYIWGRRRIYIPLYACPVILGTIMFGGVSWFPTLLVRNHGLSYTDVGLAAGLIQLFGAVCGAALGPAIARQMVGKGYKDAHLRALFLIACATIAPAVAAPLIPDIVPMLAVWSFTQLLLGSYLGIAMAAMQMRTPNQMRALNSAICMCLGTLVGGGIGTPAVGAIVQFGFQDELAIGCALAILNGICAPLAAVLIWWGLRAHREDSFLYGQEAGETASRSR
jgi:MFS family permease